METLQLLKDYAATTNNVWLKNQLDILELEIDSEKIKSKLEQLQETKQLFI